MEPPPTPKSTISTPPTSNATGHSIQFLGVLYLALTGLIDSALPAAGPWIVAGKALSYLVNTPDILTIWPTSPDLWTHIFSSVCVMSKNPSSLLHFPAIFLVSGEALVKILACDDPDLYSFNHVLLAPVAERVPSSSPQMKRTTMPPAGT
ncbi:hypothetical protein DSO57_1006357 [Entomophthora muscae]|uniref:Uncharacterized protein n=1 Tax=Entomophthora muscae TaxID=34485 RepID=A0ACC2U5F6_9FUNG|nr:hypothetical protein DSO57_1006357 [Entomophthora muscae]